MEKFKPVIVFLIAIAMILKINAIYVTYNYLNLARIRMPINSGLFWTIVAGVSFWAIADVITYLISLILIMKNKNTGYLVSGIASLLIVAEFMHQMVKNHINFTLEITMSPIFFVVLMILSYAVYSNMRNPQKLKNKVTSLSRKLIFTILIIISGLVCYLSAIQDKPVIKNQRQTVTPTTTEPILILNRGNRTVIPTPDPTEDWKTYTNNDYGFSINYFQNLGGPHVEDAPVICTTEVTKECYSYGPDQMKYVPIYAVDFLSEDKSEYSKMKISILDNKDLLSLNDWYDDYSKKMFATFNPTPLDKRIVVNAGGINGFMASESCCSSIDYNAYIPNGNRIIIINLDGNVSDNEYEKIRLDLFQMLSTFKFIN
jgi:hypothetical protein